MIYSNGTKVQSWDVNTGKPLFSPVPGWIGKFSPEGSRVLTLDKNGLHEWRLQNGALAGGDVLIPARADLENATNPKYVEFINMAQSKDGKVLAVSVDRQVIVIDLENRLVRNKIQLKSLSDYPLWDLDLNENGSRIAAVAAYKVLGEYAPGFLIIDTNTGTELPLLAGYIPPIAWSPDNQHVMVAHFPSQVYSQFGGTGGFHLWNFDPQPWVERACQVANRNLTQAEWQQYLADMPSQKTCPNLSDGT